MFMQLQQSEGEGEGGGGRSLWGGRLLREIRVRIHCGKRLLGEGCAVSLGEEGHY